MNGSGLALFATGALALAGASRGSLAKKSELGHAPDFNQCAPNALAKYRALRLEDPDVKILQLSGHKLGRPEGTDPRWKDIPPCYWVHYAVYSRGVIYDCAPRQFGWHEDERRLTRDECRDTWEQVVVVPEADLYVKSSRGGQNAPSVPPEVLEEARAASEVFRENARAWMKGMSKDVLKEDYELNWHESELRALFGRRLLGYGTYRLALTSRDRRFVVKLSMVPAQNLREARAWRDAGPKTKEILVPVLAFDPKGHWLVMERVVPYADSEDHWSPSIRALVQRAREAGVEDVRSENISSDFRILDYGQAKSLKGSPARNLKPSLGAVNATPQRWFHLTDRAKFKLSATYMPRDNSISIVDRSGRQGIYLAPELEPWLNGQGYWRPFVVEFEVDPSVKLDPGVHGRWGGELFVPASSFGKLRVRRVIPLDAYAREIFGDHGWVEDWEGKAFDTGASISAHRGPPALRGYRYDGPDVRDMGAEEVSRHKRRLRAFVKARYR